MVHSDRFGAFGLLALLGFLVLGGLGVWAVGVTQEVMDLRQANTAQTTLLLEREEQLRDAMANTTQLEAQNTMLTQENETFSAQLRERDQQVMLIALERDAWRLTARAAFTWERIWLPLALVVGLGLGAVLAWRLPLVDKWPIWAWLNNLLRWLKLSI